MVVLMEETRCERWNGMSSLWMAVCVGVCDACVSVARGARALMRAEGSGETRLSSGYE